MRRRTVLAGLAALPALAAGTQALAAPLPPAPAGAYTTIIVSPHPDDELARGAGYITHATARGDHLVLLALTDGGATGQGPREGLSTAQVEQRRAAEQTGAWSALTRGRGVIVRAGLPDGAITAAATEHAVRGVLAAYPGAEVYVAARPDDHGSDHQQACAGAANSGAAIVRYMRRPDLPGGGTAIYHPPAGALQDCHDALQAYWWTLGPRSFVGSIRDEMIRHGYRTRVTR